MKMKCINNKGVSRFLTEGVAYKVREESTDTQYYSIFINNTWEPGFSKTRFVLVSENSLNHLRKEAFNMIKSFSGKHDSVRTLIQFEEALQDMARQVHNKAWNRVKENLDT